MKKSELKALIKECILEESYEKSQIMDIIKKHKDDAPPRWYGTTDSSIAIQIRGSSGSTKWLNITKHQAIRIAAIF